MTIRILTGDCRAMMATLLEQSVQCVVTSPPYFGLRAYGTEPQTWADGWVGELGQEPTVEQYLAHCREVFAGVWRVLRDDGVLWLNIGDGFDRAKQLRMVPARLAIALQDDGWILRSDVIWAKPNPMPESVRDRPTSAHEHVFLLTKQPRYYYDAEAVKTPATSVTAKMPDGWDTGPGAHGAYHRNGREQGARTDKQRGHSRRHDGFNDRWDEMTKAEQQANGANLRNVWTIATQGFREAHFATFPEALAEICIKAGSQPGDTVLDPFGGSGTVGLVSDRLGRHAILIDLNPEYTEMERRRIVADAPLFAEVAS